MKFDKPKVTIDLDEYQYLKDKVEGYVDVKSMSDAAKMILYYCGIAMATGRSSMSDVKKVLLNHGVVIIENPYVSSNNIGWERIDIKIEPK